MVGQQLEPHLAARSMGSTILVIGNFASWQRAGRKIPTVPGFHFAAFRDVSIVLLQFIEPDLILSALMGDDYDVVELARKLAALGYIGRYRALTSNLPDPRIILTEVSAVAPQIDFDLFDLDRDFRNRH